MKTIYILLILLSAISLSAQPSYIYEGGNGYGYSSMSISASNPTPTYEGGNGNGYSSQSISSVNNTYFKGGTSVGYASISQTQVNDTYFLGGDDNGYSSIFERTPFIWTGDVGTSWTVPGNWNYNLVPGIFRPVIIPADANNWPFINAGLFNIGDNPNNGGFRCASLWIQEDALLVTRINNRVENYGLITIDGIMQIKKQTADAFKNFDGGTVIINAGGELTITP